MGNRIDKYKLVGFFNRIFGKVYSEEDMLELSNSYIVENDDLCTLMKKLQEDHTNCNMLQIETLEKTRKSNDLLHVAELKVCDEAKNELLYELSAVKEDLIKANKETIEFETIQNEKDKEFKICHVAKDAFGEKIKSLEKKLEAETKRYQACFDEKKDLKKDIKDNNYNNKALIDSINVKHNVVIKRTAKEFADKMMKIDNSAIVKKLKETIKELTVKVDFFETQKSRLILDDIKYDATNSNSKNSFSCVDIKNMRELHSNGFSLTKISKKYKCGISTLSRIIKGITYKKCK